MHPDSYTTAPHFVTIIFSDLTSQIKMQEILTIQQTGEVGSLSMIADSDSSSDDSGSSDTWIGSL